MHVHAGPDLVGRAMDVVELGLAANQAGMAGLVLKDHALPTTGQAYVLNKTLDGSCRFYGSVVLNPATGGINSALVKAALGHGAAMVFLPTYGAAHHCHLTSSRPHYPYSEKHPLGMNLRGRENHNELLAILEEIARSDAILATGHISPEECLWVIDAAKSAGVRRIVVTHASMPRIGLPLDAQEEAVKLGAYIEHSFVACTNILHAPIQVETIHDQIAHVGAEHCLLSSDLGQKSNGSPIAGFSRFLAKLMDTGITSEDIRKMTATNPAKLLPECHAP